MKRVALYVRCSTRDQDLDVQRKALQEYAKARFPEATITLYEDHGKTGTNAARPALQRMLTDARARRFDLVVCWKLDRLFRSLKGIVLTLQEFAELGIEFISLKDNVDLTTSTGRLMLHILGAFGQFEADIIRERVNAGLAHARSQGRIGGRPKRRNDAEIANLRASGLTYAQIAKQLRVSNGAVARAVKSTNAKFPNTLKNLG